jgi:hypothetical protein
MVTRWVPFPREHRVAWRGRVVVTRFVRCGHLAIAGAQSVVGGASICSCAFVRVVLPQGRMCVYTCGSVPMRLLHGALFLSGRLFRRWVYACVDSCASLGCAGNVLRLVMSLVDVGSRGRGCHC